MRAALRAVEGGVTKAEDTTIGPDQPVAVPVGGGGDARDGCVQVRAALRTVEGGVTKAEDTTVRADEPVPLPVRRRRMPTMGALRCVPPSEP